MIRVPFEWRRVTTLVCCAAGLWLGLAMQASAWQVLALTQTADGSTRRFPYITPSDDAVAGRINQRLYIETFERMAPRRAQDGLREVDDLKWKSLASVNYQLLRNDARILALQIEAEGCGAYCEAFTVPHAFDATTGRHLEIDDLITAEGRNALALRMQKNNLHAIRTHIAVLKRKQKAATSARKPQQGADDDTHDRIALLQRCMVERRDDAWRALEGVGTMAVEASALTFTQGRCSNHAMRALDDLGEFHTRWPFAELRAWLTPYGASLLLGKGSEAAPNAPFGQVLHGTLGTQQPITLWLGTVYGDGSVTGIYFYDRFRQPIGLSGSYRDGFLTLEESESKGQWQLHHDGAALRGTWAGGEKSLPILLTP